MRPVPSTPAGTRLIYVTTKDGLSVLDERGRVVVPPTVVAAATPDWSRVVTAEPAGGGTRVVIRDLASRQTLSANTLRDRLEPRMASADGRRVASVTPLDVTLDLLELDRRGQSFQPFHELLGADIHPGTLTSGGGPDQPTQSTVACPSRCGSHRLA